MENNRSKCLICDEPCPKKGLSFFEFPRNEARFKMWMKAISPLLDSLEVTPDEVREKGKICAKHFRDKDFINLKKNSLVHDACPFIGVPDLTAVLFKEDVTCVVEKDVNEVLTVENVQENDTFICGRCKVQFKTLPEFIDHKRKLCKLSTNEAFIDYEGNYEVTPENVTLPSGNSLFFDLSNRVPLENCMLHTVNEEGEIIEVVNEGNTEENEIVSFIVSENGGLLIANTPVDLTALSGQLVLKDENSGFLGTSELHEEGQDGLVLTNLSSTSNENQIILTTEGAISSAANIENTLLDCDRASNSYNETGKIQKEVLVNLNYNTLQLENNIINTSNETEEIESEILRNLNSTHLQNNVTFLNNVESLDRSEKVKTRLSCMYCKKVFDKPFNLQQHERVHTKERPFQCIICGRAFSQKANVRKHMIRHKVWPHAKQTLKINIDQDQKSIIDQDTLDRMNYSCQYCSLSFKSYSLHKKHLAVHSNFKVYRCIQKGCDETFSNLDEFLSHSESHQQAEFQCHVCLKVFTNLVDLGAHQYDHDTAERERKDVFEMKLKCEVCNAQFKTAESLKNHQAVESHNYECPQCKSVFSCERFLRRHLATHLDPSKAKFQCLICKKTFRTQKYLNNHSFIHSKEKPFNCEHCDKQFASKYRMKRHVAIHMNQFFECPFKDYLGCDKKFYRKDKLRDHAATHTYCKIRRCGFCSKTYTSTLKLQQHMKRNHKTNNNKQVLKCLSCSQTFRKQKQLIQHVCTVGVRQFKSRVRTKSQNEKECFFIEKNNREELVSNIEIIMVPFVSAGSGNIEET